MKKNSLKVALNMSKLSVPQKINRARLLTDNLAANPNVFVNQTPTLAVLGSAIDDLEAAWNAAADGGKIKTKLMHDKEGDLMKLLNDLAHYVEGLASGDENIVHLAGLDTKKPAIAYRPLFSVSNAADAGTVLLRVKAHAKTIYHWLFTANPEVLNSWQTAKTTGTCSTTIGDLESGKAYSFRVMFVTPNGESYSEVKSWVVE